VGARQLTPLESPPPPPLSPFSSIPNSLFQFSDLHCCISLPSHKSRILFWNRLEQVFRYRLEYGRCPSFLSYCIMLLVITIPRITVVYSFIVKLLLTHVNSPPPQSQCTYTQMESPMSIVTLTRKGYEMAIPSESKQHQRDASRKNAKKSIQLRKMSVSPQCHPRVLYKHLVPAFPWIAPFLVSFFFKHPLSE